MFNEYFGTKKETGWKNILWHMPSFLLLSLSLAYSFCIYKPLRSCFTGKQFCDQTRTPDREGLQEGWAVHCVQKEMGWVVSQHKSTGRS